MVCTTDIVPALMGMKYDDHDMLASIEIMKGHYVPMVAVGGGLILHIPWDWVRSLDRAGLLGLINMSHFGRLNEANACTKNLFSFFLGRILWLEKPFSFMVALISEITWLPKDGIDPS